MIILRALHSLSIELGGAKILQTPVQVGWKSVSCKVKYTVLLLSFELLMSCYNHSLVPRPHLFLEVGLVNNEHFLGCAESACHMISIATEVRL